MNTKLHAVTDTSGRPIRFIITAGQVSDYTGAMALLSSLPNAVFCARIETMVQIGFAKPCQTEAQSPASLVVSHASRPLDTTSVVTNATTASRKCSAAL
ncbi:hypothetical protein DSM14862_03497 (plasmid) [Sulfitobacter indolifex]|nr:hypothetical protein DSM14862_03497 [Sulfitobacter indolifex]